MVRKGEDVKIENKVSPPSLILTAQYPGLLFRPCRKRRPSAREDGGVSGVSSSCVKNTVISDT